MGISTLQKFLVAKKIQTPLGATTGYASTKRLTLEHLKERKVNALPEMWSTFSARKYASRVDRTREILKSDDDDNYVTREAESLAINIHMDEEFVRQVFDKECRLRNLEFVPEDMALEEVILSRSAYEESVRAERILVEAAESSQSVRELVSSHTFKWLVTVHSPSVQTDPNTSNIS